MTVYDDDDKDDDNKVPVITGETGSTSKTLFPDGSL
jgi:hypothetical protein